MKMLVTCLMLAGCASTAPQHQPPVEVDKVVAIRCIKTAPARPPYATERLSEGATDIQYADALALDWVLSRGYEKELEAAVQACLK
jgi:hypothetical protein